MYKKTSESELRFETYSSYEYLYGFRFFRFFVEISENTTSTSKLAELQSYPKIFLAYLFTKKFNYGPCE